MGLHKEHKVVTAKDSNIESVNKMLQKEMRTLYKTHAKIEVCLARDFGEKRDDWRRT